MRQDVARQGRTDRQAMGMALRASRPPRSLIAIAAIVTLAAALSAQEAQWPMYSGTYSSHRFSPLKQITGTGDCAARIAGHTMRAAVTIRDRIMKRPPGIYRLIRSSCCNRD